MSNISILAALSSLEIAVLTSIVVLFIALIVVSALLIKSVKKGRAKAEVPTQKQPPIVIYETKKVVVEKVVTVPRNEEIKIVKEVIEVKETEEQSVNEIAVAGEDTELAMRYNRSFRARLIQSDDEVKEWYGLIKNAILNHKKVASRISWKYETFSFKRNPVAKLLIKGKTLYIYLPLNAADYADTKYKLEDVSSVSQFADTPALYKLKSERRVKYVLELVEVICEKLGSEQTDNQPVDYYEPYNSDAALIGKGLVKRVIESANSSFIGASGFNKAQDADTEFEEK